MLWRRPSEYLHGAPLIQADALIVAVNIHAILRNGGKCIEVLAGEMLKAAHRFCAELGVLGTWVV